MKILPINFYCNYQKPVNKTAVKAQTNPVNQNKGFELSNVYYLPFKGKIEEKSDLYSDTSKFAQYLSERIDKDLEVPNIEDIRKAIANVRSATGCDENTARQTIAQLSQFASAKSLGAINKKLEKDSIYAIRTPETTLTLQGLLEYAGSKEQIKTYGYKKSATFLDDKLLDYYAELKKNNPELFDKKAEELKSEQNQFYILSDYNAIIDGERLEYSMFAQSDSLENLAIKVINHKKETGETLNQISNKRIKERAKSIFGEDLNIKVIRNIPPSVDDESLLSLQMPPKPTKENIEYLINIIVKEVEKCDKFKNKYQNPEQIARIVVSKYFDEILRCYSPKSINTALKKMHESIVKEVEQSGKTEDDLLYIIPDIGIIKSFDMTTYQYMVSNHIPPEKIVKIRSNSGKVADNMGFGNKVNVILDDFAGTGESIVNSKFNYRNFTRSYPDSDIIFAPLVLSREAERKINTAISNEIRMGKDKIISDSSFNFNHFAVHKMDDDECYIFDYIGGNRGYNGTNACCVFPFSAPDNNSNLAHILTSLFLFNPYSTKTSSANTEWKYNIDLSDIYQCMEDNDLNIPGSMFSDFYFMF